MNNAQKIIEGMEDNDLISIAAYFLGDPEVCKVKKKTEEWYKTTADAFQQLMFNKLSRSGTVADQDFAMVMILRDTYYDYKVVLDKVRGSSFETDGRYEGTKKEHHLFGKMMQLRLQFYKFLTAVGATPMSRKNKNMFEPPPAAPKKQHGNSKSSKFLKMLGDKKKA